MPMTNGRALPTCARAYTVGPQKYIRTGPGGFGSSTSDFVYVSKSRIDPRQRLVARQRGEHGPELRPAVASGERSSHSAQVAAHGLQLAHDLLRALLVETAVRGRPQLAEALERRPFVGERHSRSLEDRLRERARLVQVVRAAQRRHDRNRNVEPRGELF